MFVKNTVTKDIKIRSFEGYKFTIFPGVNWIWDAAGEMALKSYGADSPRVPVDKFGLSNGNGKPPLEPATEKQWAASGKRLAQVERFRVNYTQIPKKEQLIGIAQKRGVSKDKIQEFLADENIDRAIIAEAINELPVPDDVRFPKQLEQDLPPTE